jgi:O-antigen ligase
MTFLYDSSTAGLQRWGAGIERVKPLEMRLVQVFVFLAPIQTLGIFLNDSYVPFSLVAVIPLLPTFIRVCSGSTITVGVLLVGWMITAVAVGARADLLKATFDASLWLVAIIGSSVIAACLKRQLIRIEDVVKPLLWASTILAISALVQSLLSNLLQQPIDFSVLNNLSGGGIWREPGRLGPLFRSNGIAAEPAHLVQDLLPAIAVAIARLGSPSGAIGAAARGYLRKGRAVAIIAAAILSLSLIGYGILAFVALVIAGINKRRATAVLSRAAYIAVIAVVLVALIPAISHKAATVEVGLQAYKGGTLGTSTATLSVSSLALAANARVAREVVGQSPLLGAGLGSHPRSYQHYAPVWIAAVPPVIGLNAADGGSLLLRLLSETGLLGITIWLTLVGIAVRKGLRGPDPTAKLLTSALLVSAAVALARYPVYYWPMFWMLSGIASGSRPPVNG